MVHGAADCRAARGFLQFPKPDQGSAFMPASTIEFISFPSTANVTHFIAADKGFYAREGVRVNYTPTPNSVYQITETVKGRFHVAATAFDNVVAYQEGQGAVALDRAPDLFAFMGGAHIELALVVRPDVRGYADLAGRSLAVDALTTGFAFVLYKMLEKGGLKKGDYRLVSVGGTDKRWKSLRAGEHAGTLLTDPFIGFALDAGLRVLQVHTDLFPHYPTGIYAASRAWAAANRETVAGFIRAHVAAVDWLHDAANRAEAAEILVRQMPQLAQPAAEAEVEKLVSPRTGFIRGGGIDLAGVRDVLALRSEYGEPRKRLADPGKYLDLAYLEAARSRRG
jgi:ABC-type nitrate/sulfonate/bicarbonate transport system substrate-binding protein